MQIWTLSQPHQFQVMRSYRWRRAQARSDQAKRTTHVSEHLGSPSVRSYRCSQALLQSSARGLVYLTAERIPKTSAAGLDASDQPEAAAFKQPKSYLPPRRRKAPPALVAPNALQRYRHVEPRPGTRPAGRGSGRGRYSPRAAAPRGSPRVPQITLPAEAAGSKSKDGVVPIPQASKEDEERPRQVLHSCSSRAS